jgi:hypothetical protein
MDTVTLTCGHCGNLMAVTAELLGQQVRCPHCQQVVVAPASPAPLATAPADPGPVFEFQRVKDEESIFTPHQAHDDIFGDPRPAAVELPPERPECLEPPAATVSASPDPASASTIAETPPFPSGDLAPRAEFLSESHEQPSARAPADDDPDRTAVLLPNHDWMNASVEEDHKDTSPKEETQAPPSRSSPRRAAEKSSTSQVLIFLVPYAIFMTFVAGYFYFQSRQRKDPLEFLHDQPAENPGVTKKGGQVYRRAPVDSELSAKLRVPLGNTIRIGALDVTPERVERAKVVYCYTNRKTHDSSRDETLQLTLRLHNVSPDQTFYPTDPAFNPMWEEGKDKPYTFLEVGSERFYGGPLEWISGRRSTEYIQGQEQDRQPLGPGEERTTLICSNPRFGKLLSSVQKHNSTMLWRVRLRRGLVEVRNKEMSLSTVIGVQFSAADIRLKN